MKTTKQQTIAPRFIAAFLATPRAWFIKVLAVIIVGVISKGPASAGETFGTQVGSFNGVPIISNGSATYVSNSYVTAKDAQGQDYNTGMAWQCVEYANRFYLAVYAKKIRIAGTNGTDYFGTAGSRGLIAYANGGTTPPEPGDILCFSGGPEKLGHVSICRSRLGDALTAAQQNVKCTAADAEFRHGLAVRNGTYTVDGSTLGASYVCQGWLRPAGTSVSKARMTSPADGSTLPGAKAAFAWGGGFGASEYSLAFGSTPGGREWWSGSLGTATSVTFSGLPLDGSTLFVRLGTRLASGWQYSEATYRFADYRAAMTSPQPGALLPGSTATFTWSTGRESAEFFLYLGNTKGANDLWGGSLGTRTWVTFNGMPTDGRAIWVRLWTRTPSGWASADYQFRAARW